MKSTAWPDIPSTSRSTASHQFQAVKHKSEPDAFFLPLDLMTNLYVSCDVRTRWTAQGRESSAVEV
jgi:hypothetical protein